MHYFTGFVVILLALTIWLYQNSLKTIAAKDAEINILSLNISELQTNLDMQNQAILEYKVSNTKLDKELIIMQSKLREKYYNTDTLDNCESIVREKLRVFINSIDENKSR